MSEAADPCAGGIIKRLQCRGAEPGQAQAPLDSSGERDFLRERVALWARITFLASHGLLRRGLRDRGALAAGFGRQPELHPAGHPVPPRDLRGSPAGLAGIAAARASRRSPASSRRGRHPRDPLALRLHGRKHAAGLAARDDVPADRHHDPSDARRSRPEPPRPHRVDLHARRRAGAVPGRDGLRRPLAGGDLTRPVRVLCAPVVDSHGASVDTRLVRDLSPPQERGPGPTARAVHAEGEARRGRHGRRLSRRARDAPPADGHQAPAPGQGRRGQPQALRARGPDDRAG